MVTLVKSKIQNSNEMTAQNRRGAAALLMMILLAVLVILASFSINVAYIQLLRTEQKVATDAATRAAAIELAVTENQAAAVTKAKSIASLHRLGGQNFSLADNKIVFGRSVEQNGGSFVFTAGATPPNSVRVTSNIGSGVSGDPTAIPMIFGATQNVTFNGSVDSTATFLINEIILCLDRSGSMKFDMSGVDWWYPSGNPLVPYPYGFWEKYYAPPHSTDSRWAILEDAIDVFMTQAGNSAVPPRVGLVTWSSSTNSGGTSTVDYALPAKGFSWATNVTDITTKLTNRRNSSYGSNGVYGGTQLKLGIDAGVAAFNTPNATLLANKILILLTDGVYQGSDPITAATAAKNAGIKVYCISLLNGSVFNKLEDIADETGGEAYMATNQTELENAFRQIARATNVILSE